MIVRWLFNTLVLMLVAILTPGLKFDSYWAVLVASLVIGLLNALIRPLLILLTLPINILTLGLFTLVINGFIFWLASTMVKGFDISNFSTAFWGALVYTLIVTLVNILSKEAKRS